MNSNDKVILRELGQKLADISADPINQERKKLWISTNELRPIRPMILMDQLPWHEISKSEEMRLICEDPFLRDVEYSIRQILYRWNHFPCDMVVEHCVNIPRSVNNLNYGVQIQEETLATNSENDIISHKYFDQLPDENAIEALKPDQIIVDHDIDNKRLEICRDIFGEIIPVRLKGVDIHLGVWDRIAQLRPMDKILFDMVDRPEFIEKTVRKLVELTLATIDSCEELGILDSPMQYVHCTGAYINELPQKGFEPEKPRAKDCWAFGMAQMLTTVSPDMTEEFEFDLVSPLYERFGLTYYGCCEPMDNKIKYVKKLKNVRKISISPWANIEKCAEQIGANYVFSSKPNPAFISDGFHEDQIRDQVKKVLEATKESGSATEFILKDVSTVSGKLENLDRWYKLVQQMVLS